MLRLKILAVSLVLFIQTVFAANPNREFNVDKVDIPQGGVVTFDASGIKSSKKFIWNFGDGGSLTTTNSIISYQYKSAGTFTASLRYQVNASEKNPNYKEAGSATITVKSTTPKPNQAPVANLSCVDRKD